MDHQPSLPFATSHAFIIGINDYEHLSRLKTAVNDAKGIAQRLKVQHAYTVHEPLLNPTKAELDELFEQTMPQVVGPEDRVVFYFAGHGIALDGEEGPNGYLVPVDAIQGDKDSLIPMDQLHQSLNELPCKHGLLILDCCFSGAFKWSSGYRDVVFDLPKVIYEERFWRYVKDPAWQVITSSAYDQKAVDVIYNQSIGMREDGEGIYSPFAKALFEALEGEGDVIPADQGDGVITASELYAYLRDSVENQTQEQSKRQTPSMFNLSRHDKGEYIFLSPKHRFNLPPTPNRNPFMGLKSYEEKDVNLFYGRDRVVETLVELVQDKPFTVVSGASGTGKSSVIKAGLLPLLRKKGWQILPVFRPGKTPFRSFSRMYRSLLEKMDLTQPYVLVIDQYEELLTQCLHPQEQRAFENKLAELLKQYPNLKIILSVRADFEPQVEQKALSAWWQAGRYLIPAFSQDELRQVIIQPTIQEVLFFEPESLVDDLIDAVNHAPGALPLLSFTLSELYHASLKSGRNDRAFTLEDYEELGGLIGALRTKADGVYEGLDPAHQNSMRKLMMRLVSLEGGELASRRVLAEELHFEDNIETHRMHRVADQLVEARLIQKGKDAQNRVYLEPAHDALVRAWGRLWEWIQALGKEKLLIYHKLNQAVKDYQDLLSKTPQKAQKLFWNGNPNLALLKDDLSSRNHPFNKRETSFIKTSHSLQVKRRRQLIASISVFLLIVAILSYFGLRETSRANTATGNLETEKKRVDSLRVIQAGIIDSINQVKQDLAIVKDNLLLEKRRVSASSDALSLSAMPRGNVPGPFLGASLRLAEKVWDKYLGDGFTEPPVSVQGVMAERFYLQSASRKYPIPEPLYKYDLKGHGGKVLALAYAPNGESFIAAYEKGFAILWNNEGKQIAKLSGHKGPVLTVAFSPNSQYILTASEDATVGIWNQRGENLRFLTGHSKGILAATFDPNSQKILTGSKDAFAKIWDLQGNLIKSLAGHSAQINSVAFSPDSKFILTASDDNTSKIWTAEGILITDLSGHQAPISSASFSSNSRQVLTISADKTAKLWDVSGSLIHTLTDHNEELLSGGFTPRGDVYTTSKDRTLRIWNVQDGKTKIIIGENDHTDQVNQAAFSRSEGDIVTISQDRRLRLWNNSGKLRALFKGHGYTITTVAISPDGSRIVSGSPNGELKVWSLDQGPLPRIRNMGTKAVFSQDGQKLMTSFQSGIARVWNIQGSMLGEINGRNSDLTALDISKDDKWVLLADKEGWITIRNLQTQETKNFQAHKEAITSARFSPDGQQILTGSTDKTAKLWTVDGNLQATLQGHAKQINTVDFSPSGDTLLTTAEWEPPFLWNSNGNKLPITFQAKGRENRVHGAYFSPDGKNIISWNRNVHEPIVWNLIGEELFNLKGHDSHIYRASFSTDGTQIITTGSDNVKLWSSTGEHLFTLSTKSEAEVGLIAPDGKTYYTGLSNRTGILWPAPSRIHAWLKSADCPLPALSNAEEKKYESLLKKDF